jgi:hypothetical protein
MVSELQIQVRRGCDEEVHAAQGQADGGHQRAVVRSGDTAVSLPNAYGAEQQM